MNINKRSYKLELSLLLFLLTLIFPAVDALSQDMLSPIDSLKMITMDEVVITANRYENKLLNSGTAVNLIKQEGIQRLPVQSFSGLLNYLPGIYAGSGDGMGLNPQVSIRGFYGGGEAEYLQVLVDGVPMNDLETGLVSWNLIPLEDIQQVELLRGGSSALYGDAAMGGVMNIRTLKKDKKFTRANLGYGAYNSYILGASHGGSLGNGSYEIYLSNNSTDGYREHSQWNSLNFGGRVKLPLSRSSSLTFSTHNQILDSDDPGFLSQAQVDSARKQSQSYFRADGNDMQKYLANLEFNSRINPEADLNISLNYQHKNTEQYRTFGQYPTILAGSFEMPYPVGVYDTSVYANTKKRELTTDQLNLALRLSNRVPELGAIFSGGIEASYGAYQNSYYDIFRGFENDYTNNYTPWDLLDTKGTGYRVKAAAYLNGEILLAGPLSLIAGLRYDLIVDDFEGTVPDTTISKNNSALSPKVGLKLSTGETDTYAGSIYLNYSYAFKAPTIDQRTDFKQLHYYLFFEAGPAYIPVEMKAPPFSNADLKPQTSMNYELGTYQYFKINERISSEIQLTGYYIKVKDEIDFDLQTQRYKNLVNTEHTGLETSIRVNMDKVWNAFVNYSFTEVKFIDGENDGKTLKGVPKNVLTAGLSYSPPKGFGASLMMNSAGGIYLDDENEEKLDPFAKIDARLDYKFKFATVYLDVLNLFDTKYNSAGYRMDGKKFLFPAAGRFVRGGINISL